MASLMKNLAPDYSSSKSYVSGDRVLYNKKLYNCIKSTTGSFDADCWEDIYISDLVKGGLNSNLGGFEKLNYVSHSMAGGNMATTQISISNSGIYLLYAFGNDRGSSTDAVITISTSNSILYDSTTKRGPISGNERYACTARVVIFSASANSNISVSVTCNCGTKQTGYVLFKPDKNLSLSFDSIISSQGIAKNTLTKGKYLYISEGMAQSSNVASVSVVAEPYKTDFTSEGISYVSGSESLGAGVVLWGTIDVQDTAEISTVVGFVSGHSPFGGTMFFKLT